MLIFLQARELKTIRLDAEGNFVKLVLHKNHVNKYNIYNQASWRFEYLIIKYFILMNEEMDGWFKETLYLTC